MPKVKNALIRYRIIDACLRNKAKSFPSLQDLIDEVSERVGFVSKRTIQADISDMKFDTGLGYFAPIEYNNVFKGYYYSDENYTIGSIPLKHEDLQAIEFAAITLAQYGNVPIFSQFRQTSEKILNSISVSRILDSELIHDYIEFETAFECGGIENLPPLVQAIKSCEVVAFQYQSFVSAKVKTIILHPYLLKEYRNRWYAIGLSKSDAEIRTYALDRISAVTILPDEEYEYPLDFNKDLYFKHAFGITSSRMAPVDVELSFSPLQGKYIKSLPLHHSQQEIIDSEEEYRIKLKLVPSPEFIMQLISYGDQVEVLSPQSLRKEIKHKLESAVQKYKGN